MKITRTSALSALATAALFSSYAPPALTQTEAEPAIEEVVVRAHPLSAEGLAQPTAVLNSDQLQRVVASSLGETLVGLPSVHSSSFGQAVGRPIIRGLGGPRVKTMEDRIDSLDVSVSSPDHLTTVEPFAANSIEVLKGPSTLLYGTGAIGGVVDVHTGRIPHEVPDKVSVQVDARGADNAERRSTAAKLDAGIGGFAIHLDGFYREADDYEIPGFAESRGLRALEEAEHEGEEEHEEEGEHGHEEEEAFGELPGSDLKAHGGAFGLSYVGERGFIGLAVSSYEAEYGLPGHGHHEEEGHAEEEGEEAHEEEEEEGNPNLDLEQTRIDFEAGLSEPFAGIESINLRIGANDYEHIEVEGNGEPGTTFSTEAYEARIELVHEEALGIKGSFGVQISQREFEADGEEAFVRPVDTDNYGVFYVGERYFGKYQVEGGVRLERVKHKPTENESRNFNLQAASLGVIRPLGNHWTVSAQIDHSSRAPVAEELYSNGPHLATSSFEIGDSQLDKEIAFNIAASVEYVNEGFSFILSAYRTDFDDFIFELATGEEEDELPVLQWQQQDADFQGFEADVNWQALRWDGGSLAFNAGFDTVRARLSGTEDDDLPRIPPQRWRVGSVLTWNNFIAEINFTQVDSQDDVSPNELPTRGYDNLRAYLGYRAGLGDSTIEFFVRGENLTDDEQRYHTSFIKDLAPQPGRTIEGGVTIRI